MTRGGEEEPKKGEGKGFAGLSSLVSDIDTMSPPLTRNKGPAATSANTGRPISQPDQQQPSQRQGYEKPAQPSFFEKFFFGTLIVSALYLVIGGFAPTITTFFARVDSAPARSAAPNYVPPTPAPAPPQPQAPSRPTESKPPVGQGLVLSREQIRYCLAEDIRIDAAKSAVNNYNDSDVARFNAMVADYNSRCSSFQYQTSNRGRNDLKSAQRDIEPFRNQLQSEGRSRFPRASTGSLPTPAPERPAQDRASTGSLSTPVPERPAQDATVQAIQRKLNELGYDAGTVDGLMGRKTRSAIIAFQKDRGLTPTGMADEALLIQLQRAPVRPTSGWGTNDPVWQAAPARPATTVTAHYSTTPSPSEQRLKLPANDYVMGSNWYC